MDQNWLSNLAIKAMRICRLDKEAAGNHRQDMTGPILQNLSNNGFTQVTWNSNGSHHSECQDLNGQVWDLQNFLATSEYDAPLFSRSHPGDNSCTLTVSGPGLSPVTVDSYGDVDTDIGTSRPAPTPKPVPAPKPQLRTIAPEPKPKVELAPEKPEKKVVYVPKEVHKEIKDPFEKQDDQDQAVNQDRLTDEEYLEWLKELEQEQVQESIPAKKELTDEDWDEIKNFNVETSKKIPNWITGLFKG